MLVWYKNHPKSGIYKYLLAVLLRYYTLFTQGVYKMLGQNWGVSFPHQHTANFSTNVLHVRTHAVFKVQPPRSPDLSHFDCYLSGHLKSLPIRFQFSKRHFPSAVFDACQIICNISGIFECGDSPWSDVAMRAVATVHDKMLPCVLWFRWTF